MSQHRLIDLNRIDFDPNLRIRAAIDYEVVGDYCDAMKLNANFPPIEVFENGNRYIGADGEHRYLAAKEAKKKSLYANVHKGNARDALRFALCSNSDHGLRRNNADKRKAAAIALKEFGDLSDNALADICGVSAPFIAIIRRELVEVPSPNKRIGLDGKLRRLPVLTPKALPKSEAPSPNQKRWHFVNGQAYFKSFGPYTAEEITQVLQEFETLVPA